MSSVDVFCSIVVANLAAAELFLDFDLPARRTWARAADDFSTTIVVCDAGAGNEHEVGGEPESMMTVTGASDHGVIPQHPVATQEL